MAAPGATRPEVGDILVVIRELPLCFRLERPRLVRRRWNGRFLIASPARIGTARRRARGVETNKQEKG